MKSLHQRLIRHRSALLLSFFRLLTYGCLFCLFFGLMSIHNWYLLNPSRTLATTLLTFVSMAVVMNADDATAGSTWSFSSVSGTTVPRT